MQNVNFKQNYKKEKIDKHFLCDVLCFFAGLQSGQVDNYCYSESMHPNDPVKGGDHWENFIKQHTKYYPYHDEIKLISKNLNNIVIECKNTSEFIDLGVGSIKAFKNKTLPFLKKLAPIQYKAIDINEEFIVHILDYLKKREPFIRTSSDVYNFFEHLSEFKKNSTMYLSGITISNIKADLRYETIERCLTKTLQHFSNALPNGGRFVFTFDSNQNEKSIKEAYNHQEMHKHNTNLISLIKRDLPTKNLYEENFDHFTKWIPEQHLLKHCLRVKKSINFDVAGHNFNLKANTELHVTNCFKFTDDLIYNTAKNAGFSKIKFYKLDNSPIRLVILKKPLTNKGAILVK